MSTAETPSTGILNYAERPNIFNGELVRWLNDNWKKRNMTLSPADDPTVMHAAFLLLSGLKDVQLPQALKVIEGIKEDIHTFYWMFFANAYGSLRFPENDLEKLVNEFINRILLMMSTRETALADRTEAIAASVTQQTANTLRSSVETDPDRYQH